MIACLRLGMQLKARLLLEPGRNKGATGPQSLSLSLYVERSITMAAPLHAQQEQG